MPFKESEIQKHLNYLDEKSHDDGEHVHCQLFQVVTSQEEADEHNELMRKQEAAELAKSKVQKK